MTLDLIITTLDNPLANWMEAFPTAELFRDPGNILVAENLSPLFWLHEQSENQNWLTTTIQKIRTNFPKSRIVVLANTPNESKALSALALGVAGYCHAYSTAETLSEVRTAVTHGGLWMGQDLLQHLILATTGLTGNKPEQISAYLAQLTQREREVAIEAAKGFANKEIARTLNITERTVKAHLSSCFERLGVKDRLQLALMLNEKAS